MGVVMSVEKELERRLRADLDSVLRHAPSSDRKAAEEALEGLRKLSFLEGNRSRDGFDHFLAWVYVFVTVTAFSAVALVASDVHATRIASIGRRIDLASSKVDHLAVEVQRVEVETLRNAVRCLERDRGEVE
jgi:hypothetical protein